MVSKSSSSSVAGRRQRRVIRSGVAGPLLALALAAGAVACGSDDDTSSSSVAATRESTSVAPDATSGPTSSADGTEPVAGGHATVLYAFPFPGFDPAKSGVNSPSILQNFAVYDALAIESPSTATTELRLLESADTADGLVWTLTLLPDLVFSDGTPFDAEAIKFNWQRLADPATQAQAAPAAQTIASMEAVDAVTLQVTLVAANPQFPTLIATNALTWIGSPTAIAADPVAYNASPVGAGPFLLDEWVPQSQETFVRNPNYHGEPAHLDGFTVKLVQDETQRLATMRSGDADIFYTASGVTQASATDYSTVTVPRNGGYMLFFNTSKAPFDDARARRALSLALDPVALTKDAIGEAVQPAESIFLDTSPYYDASLHQPEADRAQAQSLFDELAAENGGLLELSLSFVPTFQTEATYFQTVMAGFDNVSLSLDPVDPSTFYTRYKSGDVTVGMHAMAFFAPEFLGQFVGTDGQNNFVQWSDPELDELLRQGQESQELAERVDIYKEVQRKILDAELFRFIHRTQSWWDFDPEHVKGLTLENVHTQYGVPMMNEVWLVG